MMTRTTIAWLALIGLAGCARGSLGGDRAGTDVQGPDALLPQTRVAAAMNRTITSRSDKAGETVTATVTADVKNGRGQVVIPAGSTVELRITQLEPARNKSQSDGKLALQVLAVSVRGQRYPAHGEVTSVPHTLKGRGVTAGEAEKVGVGTVVGAVAGRVIGGNAKGTLIGGAVGAAGGTAVAIETASRDVVVSAGAPVMITLTSPLRVSRN
jgi:hypothetical protein